MARQETKYIVIHCSQTRPSQNWGAKEIDRVHREFGWLKIGYGKVILRNGEVQQGRGDDEVQAHVAGYNHTAFGLCLCPQRAVWDCLLFVAQQVRNVGRGAS